MKFKTAKCERTGHKILLSDGYYIADVTTGEWSFVGLDAPEKPPEYHIEVRELSKSPEALVDWIAHLNEKSWFDPKKFCDFFTRFREENELFNIL